MSAPKNSPALMAVLERVAAERIRQKQLLRDGKILFNCDSPVVDENRKLRILMEEVGEVAEAMDRVECSKNSRAKLFAQEDLETELVQVAAVVFAWLETYQHEARP